MIVVIADTSPINYLVLIGEIGILPQLYHHIVIPEDVFVELTDRRAPPEVREWAARYPGWMEIRKVQVSDPALVDLDAGEAAAIVGDRHPLADRRIGGPAGGFAQRYFEHWDSGSFTKSCH